MQQVWTRQIWCLPVQRVKKLWANKMRFFPLSRWRDFSLDIGEKMLKQIQNALKNLMAYLQGPSHSPAT